MNKKIFLRVTIYVVVRCVMTKLLVLTGLFLFMVSQVQAYEIVSYPQLSTTQYRNSQLKHTVSHPSNRIPRYNNHHIPRYNHHQINNMNLHSSNSSWKSFNYMAREGSMRLSTPRTSYGAMP